VVSATPQTLLRSIRSRRKKSEGGERQKAVYLESQRLGIALARKIPVQATHVVVSQSLLPFLHQAGVLGGRTYDVLMNRRPLDDLNRTLNFASRLQPESRTLKFYRAPTEQVSAEMNALLGARRLITAHRYLAGTDKRVHLIEWPNVKPFEWKRGPRIAFPGPTIGRKGAYELREVARSLGLEVVLLGPNLEGEGFWDGVQTILPEPGTHWGDGIFAVVQPAYLEDRPIKLLSAIASGCPVVCTPQCGLSGIAGITEVQPGDVDALLATLKQLQSDYSAGLGTLGGGE
jgi:hypothetical protein